MPSGKGSCYSGPDKTQDVGACKAGTRTCNSTGTAWLPGCADEVTPAKEESCDTPADDDCDGSANPASLCGPAEYFFAPTPNCGSYCYFDEPHNVNVSGDGANNAGIGTYAVGQLVDGKKGGDNWSSDLGNGPAFEWLGWSTGAPVATFRFPKTRALAQVTVGLNNFVTGGVSQPSAVTVQTSVDGVSYSKGTKFSLGDKTMAAIPVGKRGDVVLKFASVDARYVRLSFERVNWTFVDEVSFD